MDDPREQMQADLKDAMRAKDRQRVTVLRMALNAIKQEEIDTRQTLDAQAATAILQREVKKRRESIAEAEKLGRPEIAESEQAEIDLLSVYLPRQLGRDEIMELARSVVAETGAQTPKDLGNVMKVLMPQVKGKADGKLVNEVVRELLSG